MRRFPCALLALLLALPLKAGGLGKIAGRVTDKTTGEPLPYASVRVLELDIGASTDAQGYYFLLDIPPGTYTLRVDYLGYRPVEMQGVRVELDKTTFVNVALEPVALEVEPVVVKAEKPLVEPDVTWKSVSVSGEEITALPVTSVQEALQLQGGVTLGAGGELHVRGGRPDEILYVIDGLPVRNPLTGGFGGVVDRSALDEMALVVGSFSAEYGDALSGVVNITTGEPGSKPAFYLEYLADRLNPSPYRRPDMLGPGFDAHRDTLTGASLFEPQDLRSLKGVPFLGELRGRFQFPLPWSGFSALLAGAYLNHESPYPFGYELRRSLTGKIAYRSGGLRAFLTLQRSQGEVQHYNHKWKYNWRRYHVTEQTAALEDFTLRHLVSERLFWSLTLGRYAETEHTAVPGKSPDEVEPPVSDECVEFYVGGDSPLYRDARTTTYTVKGDLTYQRGHHELKAGGEARFHRLFLESYERLFVVSGFIGPRIHQKFTREPREAALYVRDKIEYPNLVLNLGLRLDYADPRAKMWEDPRNPLSPLVRARPKWQLSPRLGVAYPLTANAVLHFSYGHFFQNPPYEAAYKNPQFLNPDSLPPQFGFVGNPNLNPQRTVAYEFGLALGFGNLYSLDLTLYAKDIWDLLSTREVRVFPYDYAVYENADFATVRGLDLTLRRRFREGIGFTLSYTLQVARGNRSFPLQGFYDAYTGQPEAVKEYYLDFDRRHSLALTASLRMPLGVQVGILSRFESGLPYTPYAPPGVVVEVNSARMPPTFTLDLLARRRFRLKGLTLEALLEVRNLTDRKNPRFVYPRTGDPWDPGDYAGVGVCTEDYAKNPAHYGPPRRIRLGLRVEGF